MSEETRSTSQPTDTSRLKRLDWFKIQDSTTGALRLDRELWAAVTETNALITQRPHSTVFYPGAFMDIPFPLALTDADTYVFVDPSYKIGPAGKDGIVKSLKKVDHNIIVQETDDHGEQITFTFNGKPRSIHLYAEDAASFVPEELRQRPADILFLKNTYGGPTELHTPEAFETLLSSIQPEGTVVAFGWDIPAQRSSSPKLQELSSKPLPNIHGGTDRLHVFSHTVE